MTLPSGADVKIGTYEFQLEESQDKHYLHSFERVADQSNAIQGQDDKRQLRGRLLWTYEDWSGGEGNRIYYPDQPDRFWWSESANPRIRGQITGRPKRALDAVTVLDGDMFHPQFVIGGGELSLFCGRLTGSQFVWAQRASGSWTTVTDTATLNFGTTIYALTGDLQYQYWAGTNAAAAAVIGRRTPTGISTVYTTSALYIGLAIMGGYLYGWGGDKLYRHPITDLATSTQVSPALQNTGAAWQEHQGDITVCDNEVVCWSGQSGTFKVYAYHEERGFSELWSPPPGLVIMGSTYQNGICYFVMQDQGGSSPRSHIYGINMNTREAFYATSTPPAAKITKLQFLVAAEKNTLLLADGDTYGESYIYDTETGALTPFDYYYVTSNPDTTDATLLTGSSNRYINDVAFFASKRFVAIRGGSTNEVDVLEYESDEPEDVVVNTATGDYSTRVVMPYHDMGYPHDGKNLVGFHITYQVDDTATTSGLKNGQEIVIKYSLDGDAAATTLATLTKDTVPSSGIKGRHFVSALVAGTKKGFFQICPEFQLVTKNDAVTGAKCPVVKAFTIEAEPNGYLETWDLILRIKDESSAQRPSTRTWHAETLRDYLEDLAQNRDPVTFLDGFRKRGKGDYTSHTVMIADGPYDVIERNGEGYMAIRLKSVVV